VEFTGKMPDGRHGHACVAMLNGDRHMLTQAWASHLGFTGSERSTRRRQTATLIYLHLQCKQCRKSRKKKHARV